MSKPDPKRTVSIRNLTPMVLKLHLDVNTAERAREQKVIGICETADVLILGHALGSGKRHTDDMPGEIEVPGWLWDAALKWDPPAHRGDGDGPAHKYQAKLIKGYEKAGDLQIRGA
jgi:hypothetical protein